MISHGSVGLETRRYEKASCPARFKIPMECLVRFCAILPAAPHFDCSYHELSHRHRTCGGALTPVTRSRAYGVNSTSPATSTKPIGTLVRHADCPKFSDEVLAGANFCLFNAGQLQCELGMSSISMLDPELLTELVSDIDGLGVEVSYLRAIKASIRKAVTERNVPLDVICESVNQRLRKFGRLVEPTHIQAILDESDMASAVSETVFRTAFRGRAPPSAPD